MCKQETAFIFKIPIYLISVGLWFITLSNAKFLNNTKCIADSGAHQQNTAHAPDLLPQSLPKLKEKNQV